MREGERKGAGKKQRDRKSKKGRGGEAKGR